MALITEWSPEIKHYSHINQALTGL